MELAAEVFGLSVAVFSDDEFDGLCRVFGIEVDWPMDKHDDIGILFDGSRFAQVG